MTLDEQYRKILYTIMEAREDMGVKLREIEPRLGISKATYESVVYSRHAASFRTVLRIADAVGLEIVIRRKPDWDEKYGPNRPTAKREWGKRT